MDRKKQLQSGYSFLGEEQHFNATGEGGMRGNTDPYRDPNAWATNPDLGYDSAAVVGGVVKVT